MPFQIPKRANGLGHNPRDYLAEALFFSALVVLQDRVGFVTEVGGLSHKSIYTIYLTAREASRTTATVLKGSAQFVDPGNTVNLNLFYRIVPVVASPTRLKLEPTRGMN